MFQIADAACRAVGVRCVVISPLCAQFPAVKAGRGAQVALFGFAARCFAPQVEGRDGLAERAPVDPPGRGVEQSAAGEFAQDREDAARTVDILDMVMRVGGDLAQYGHPARKAVDILHREIHPGLVGHGQQVQHRIGRAAHGDVERHGILEGCLRGHRAREQVIAFGIADDQRCGLFEQAAAVDMRGHDGAVARERESERFGQAVHRVGGEHPRARTAAGACGAFDASHLFVAAIFVGSHHHGVDQVERPLAEVPRLHRPARYEDGRDVEPHGGHQHARGDLVAVRDADQCVDLVGVGHIFDAVGNDLARGQRIKHAVVPHGDAVVDGDGVEFRGETAERFDPLLDVLSDLVQVHVSRNQLGERVGDADDRTAELLFAHAVGTPQAPGSGHAPARRRDGTSEWVFHLLLVFCILCLCHLPG